MRKILIYFISFFLLLYPIMAFATNSFQEKYVSDKAKLLNKKTEAYISSNSKILKENFNISYYLITLPSLNNQNIDIYSEKLETHGILILVVKDERTIKVKVGKELSNIITNEIIQEYLDTFFTPYLKNNQWNEGIKNGYSAFLKLIYASHGIDNEDIIVKDVNNFLYEYKYYLLCAIIWISTILSYVLCAYFKKNLLTNKKKVQKLDTIIFSTCIFLNIIILLVANYLEPVSVILIIIYELSLIKSNYKLVNKSKKNNHKSSKNKSKGTRK